MRRKKTVLEKISTKPGIDSYRWADGISLFSAVTLWLLWLARVFSLLQWVKLAYRTIVAKIKKSTTDRNSRRINVPAWVVEVYFLAFFALEICVLEFVSPDSVFRMVVSTYYLFESFVWTIYYTIFRRFFEENYKTQHALEYFIVFPLVLVTQIIAFSCILETPFRTVLLWFTCLETADYIIVNILGLIYQALVIGMIIASFPEERTKAGMKRTVHVIIGYGDVVKNRLLPALIRQKEFVRNIFDVASPGTDNDYSKVCEKENTQEILDTINKEIHKRCIIWVETPSNTHFSYLSGLLDVAKKHHCLVVIEKPIAINSEELLKVKEINNNAETRSLYFYLSYYLLEKALPLYYLSTKNEAYLKYLDCSNIQLFDTGLGKLTNMDVTIIEGEEKRQSVNESEGGQIYETMIHNVLLASLYVGLPETWKNVKATNDKQGGLKIEAQSGETKIVLIQEKKKDADYKRFALLKYEYGNVYMNIDTGILTVNRFGYGTATISLKKEYLCQKYSVQTDLAIRVFNNEMNSESVDGLVNQIECLEWMTGLDVEEVE